jgi:hypothetical protein
MIEGLTGRLSHVVEREAGRAKPAIREKISEIKRRPYGGEAGPREFYERACEQRDVLIASGVPREVFDPWLPGV